VGAEVSTSGDMYSFGILMLEMLTGRRPTDEIFEDGQNICNFVAMSFASELFQILDLRLIPIGDNDWNLNPDVEKCLVSLFRIGLACAMESPKERMDVVDVSRELQRIQKAFFGEFIFFNPLITIGQLHKIFLFKIRKLVKIRIYMCLVRIWIYIRNTKWMFR